MADLLGVTVLVTRPEDQADHLCHDIEYHGGVTLRYPLLVISPPTSDTLAQQQIAKLNNSDIVIFISANAVHYSWPFITAQGGISHHVQVASVGIATKAALAEKGQATDLVPVTDFSSEGLLQLPAMKNVSGKHVLIVRGEGGKETLATELKKRGAQVDYAQVYRRKPPVTALPSSAHAIDVIIISSAESLQNLVTIAQQQQANWVFRTTLLLVHPRLRVLAEQFGFKLAPVIAQNATDQAMLEALIKWRRARTV